jgi:hypothetical protein
VFPAVTRRLSACSAGPQPIFAIILPAARPGTVIEYSIAREIGCSTEFAFSNAFRREYGVLPGRLRQAEVPFP